MKKFRVITVRRMRSPDHWGVQRLAGYTDGRPSYQLVRRFWSKSKAVAYAAIAETMGLQEAERVIDAGDQREPSTGVERR